MLFRSERFPGLEVHLTGIVFLNNAFSEMAMQDMKTLLPLMFVIITVLMVLMLRSFWGTLATVIVILLSIVTAMGLATAFAQTLGMIFTRDPKPFETEILLAEISEDDEEHRLFRITYDGTLYDERRFVAIGGKTEELTEALEDLWQEEMSLEDALVAGAEAFRRSEERESEGWEAAVLDHSNGRRSFRRLDPSELPG